MATIPLAIGSSHGPTMNTPPERWLELGEKDMQDSRFDFARLLQNRPAGIEDELTLERFEQRHTAVQNDVDALNGILMEARPDAVVVLSNPHGGIRTDVMQPTFGIYLNDPPPSVEGPSRPGRQDPVDGNGSAAAKPSARREQYPTDGDLAHRIMTGLIEEGFDVAALFQSSPGAGLDGAFDLLYQRYDTSAALPYVPILISRYLPNQATPRRCYAFGQALGRVIRGWDSDRRVVLMASGGLSHQIIDEELDRMVIAALGSGNAEVLGSIPRERLNYAPGTPEILNWIAVAGAMAPATMTLLDYQPCYRSPAGTGHGVTFGYWR